MNDVVLNEAPNEDTWEEPEEVSFISHAMVKVKKGDFKVVSRKQLAKEKAKKKQELTESKQQELTESKVGLQSLDR